MTRAQPSTHAVPPASQAAAPRAIRTSFIAALLLLLVAVIATFPGYLPGRIFVAADTLDSSASPIRSDAAPDGQLLDHPAAGVTAKEYFVRRLKDELDRVSRESAAYKLARLRNRDAEEPRPFQFPLWNPHQQMGAPLLANPQSALLYPTIILHYYLPSTWAWTLSATLRLWIAGWGAWTLARRCRIGPAGSLLAAAAFMLCGQNIVGLNSPQTNVIPLLPWAIIALERLIERTSPLRTLALAIVLALGFLGGHPASIIHLLLACAIVWAIHLALGYWRDSAVTRLRILAAGCALALSIVVGFLAAGAQWLPYLAYAADSGAASWREAHPQLARATSFSPAPLLGLLFPHASGFPDPSRPSSIPLFAQLPPPTRLSLAWVGTVPLLLSIFAAISAPKDRRILPWLILALAALAIGISVPGLSRLVACLPIIQPSQHAGFLFVAALAMALLSGFALDLLVQRLLAGTIPIRLPRGLLAAAASLAILSVLGIVLILLLGRPSSSAAESTLSIHRERIITSSRLLIPAAVLAATALILLRARHRAAAATTPPAAPTSALVGLAVLDLLLFAAPYNRGAPADRPDLLTPQLRYLQSIRTPDPRTFRFAAIADAFPPESATRFALREVRGLDSLTPRRVYDFLRATAQVPDLPPASAQTSLASPGAPSLNLLSLRYLITPPLTSGSPRPPAPWAPVFPSTRPSTLASVPASGAIVWENTQSLPRARLVKNAERFDTPAAVLERIAKMDFDPRTTVLLDRQIDPEFDHPGEKSPLLQREAADKSSFGSSIEWVEDLPERIVLRARGGGWLVLSDACTPGWRAKLDIGEAVVYPAYGALRAIPMPTAASTTLTLEYRPKEWTQGLFASAMGGVLMALLLGASLLTDLRPSRIPALAPAAP